MKKLLSFLTIILFSMITFASAEVKRVNFSTQEVSTKRIVFTDTGLPNGIPMFDINNEWSFNLLWNNIKTVDNSLYSDFYTSNWSWYSYNCKSFSTVNITWTIPASFDGNTKYVFESGSYTIWSPIVIDESCTVLIWSWNVILNWTGWIILNITGSQYNIIEWLKFYWSWWDSISMTNANNNAIYNLDIIKSNRAILMSNSKYNLFKNSRLYSSTIWFSLATNSNYNVINNCLSFNHTQNWIFINGWYYNVVNNSAVFNNTLRWYIVQSWTWNVFNNSFSLNNTSDWLRSVAINFYNNTYNLNNWVMTITATNTWYGNNYSDTWWDVDLKWGLSTDLLVSDIWRSNWTWLITTLSTGFLIIPYDENSTAIIDITTWSTDWKWAKPFTWFLTNIIYWLEVIEQIQPVDYIAWKLSNDNYFNEDTLIASWFDFVSFWYRNWNLSFLYGNTPMLEITKYWIKTDWIYIWDNLKIVNSWDRVSLQYLSWSDWIEQ